MRHLAVALVVLLATVTPSAHATLITAYAIGTVTENLSVDGPNAGSPILPFTVGEAVYLIFRFDPEISIPFGGGAYDLRPATFRVLTAGGYSASGGGGVAPRSGVVTDGSSDRFSAFAGSSNGRLALALTDPTGQALSSTDLPTAAEWLAFPGGTLEFNRERGFGLEGFRASIVPVADTSGFPLPEPSTLMLGLVGVGLLGLAGVRRRRAAA